MMDPNTFNRIVTGATLLERWRTENFPELEWEKLVEIISKQWQGSFDDFCWGFASGRVLLAVGDYADIHLFFLTI